MGRRKKVYVPDSDSDSDSSIDSDELDILNAEGLERRHRRSDDSDDRDKVKIKPVKSEIVQDDDLDIDTKSEFMVKSIDTRDRQDDEKKWTLGYNDYMIISSYLPDTISRINFTRVCTRTRGAFIRPSNLGVNITDSSYWEMLTTHIIHTDMEPGINRFLPTAKFKRLAGNHMSLETYLDQDIIIFKKKYSEPRLVSIEGNLPEEIIDLVHKYMAYKEEDLHCGWYIDTISESARKDIIELYNRSRQFVGPRLFNAYITLSQWRDDGDVYKHNVYRMIRKMLNDKTFMDMVSEERTITRSYNTEHYITINNIDFPVYSHVDDYVDVEMLAPVFRSSTKIMSGRIKLPLESLEQTVQGQKMSEECIDLYNNHFLTNDNAIFVTMVVSCHINTDRTTGENSYVKTEYTVVSLPLLLFNFFQVAYPELIDPFTESFYYIKGTSVLCTYTHTDYNAVDITRFDPFYEMTTSSVYPESLRFRHLKKYIVGVDVYRLDNIMAVIPSDFDTEHISNRVLELLGLKYNYVSHYNTRALEKRFVYEHLYDIKKHDIFDFVMEPQIVQALAPNCLFKFVEIGAIDLLGHCIRKNKLHDYSMIFYIDGHIVPFVQYLDAMAINFPDKIEQFDEDSRFSVPLRLFMRHWREVTTIKPNGDETKPNNDENK